MSVFFFIVFFFAKGAQADVKVNFNLVPTRYCKTAATVAASVFDCKGNANFVDAILACEKKLETLEAVLGKEVQDIANRSAGNQRAKLDTGEQVYDHSSKSLQFLILAAENALVHANAYAGNLVLPVGLTFETDDDPKDILKQEKRIPCYGENLKKVESAQDYFQTKIARYKERLAAAQKNHAILVEGIGNFGAQSNDKILEAQKPLERSYAPLGVEESGLEKGSSDISGPRAKKK